MFFLIFQANYKNLHLNNADAYESMKVWCIFFGTENLWHDAVWDQNVTTFLIWYEHLT